MRTEGNEWKAQSQHKQSKLSIFKLLEKRKAKGLFHSSASYVSSEWNIPTAYKRREKCGDYEKHEYKNHLGRIVTYMHGGWRISDRIYLVGHDQISRLNRTYWSEEVIILYIYPSHPQSNPMKMRFVQTSRGNGSSNSDWREDVRVKARPRRTGNKRWLVVFMYMDKKWRVCWNDGLQIMSSDNWGSCSL